MLRWARVVYTTTGCRRRAPNWLPYSNKFDYTHSLLGINFVIGQKNLGFDSTFNLVLLIAEPLWLCYQQYLRYQHDKQRGAHLDRFKDTNSFVFIFDTRFTVVFNLIEMFNYWTASKYLKCVKKNHNFHESNLSKLEF